MSTATPMPAHTAPSGKVTKWSIPGSAETYRTKREAQAALDAAAEFDPAAVLPEGAEVLDGNGYSRVRVGGRPLGYVVPRREGFQVEVLSSRLEGAPAALFKGTRAHQGQTRLHVRDAKTLAQAEELLAAAAKSAHGA